MVLGDGSDRALLPLLLPPLLLWPGEPGARTPSIKALIPPGSTPRGRDPSSAGLWAPPPGGVAVPEATECPLVEACRLLIARLYGDFASAIGELLPGGVPACHISGSQSDPQGGRSGPVWLSGVRREGRPLPPVETMRGEASALVLPSWLLLSR
jgi:hypothetical protein